MKATLILLFAAVAQAIKIEGKPMYWTDLPECTGASAGHIVDAEIPWDQNHKDTATCKPTVPSK